MPLTFVTASVAFVRADGHLLTVRKRGTHRFMLPGGKLEPGETALAAAIREVAEEVGLTVTADSLTMLGSYAAAAANEPGAIVESDVYRCTDAVDPRPQGEIEELRWVDLAAAPADDLAPLLIERVIPALLTVRDHDSPAVG